jgi:ABC-type multidrug transport system ATPase subunit
MSLIIQQLILRRGQRQILNHYQQQFVGQRHCLIAPNGAGKSSLLAAIAGLLPHQGGDIFWHQQRLTQADRAVALASDSIPLPDFLTGRALLQLQQQMWQLPAPDQLLTDFDFLPQQDCLIADLSAGNRKKLTLIAALMRQPELLLLDEPNIALDEQAQQALWHYVDQYPGMIIAASHDGHLFQQHQFSLVPLHAV